MCCDVWHACNNCHHHHYYYYYHYDDNNLAGLKLEVLLPQPPKGWLLIHGCATMPRCYDSLVDPFVYFVLTTERAGVASSPCCILFQSLDIVLLLSIP